MNATVTGRHFDLTPAIKNHVTEKLEEPLARLVGKKDVRLQVELSLFGRTEDREDFEVRAHLTLPGGKSVHITQRDRDVYKAVNAVEDRMLNQVKRQLERTADARYAG